MALSFSLTRGRNQLCYHLSFGEKGRWARAAKPENKMLEVRCHLPWSYFYLWRCELTIPNNDVQSIARYLCSLPLSRCASRCLSPTAASKSGEKAPAGWSLSMTSLEGAKRFLSVQVRSPLNKDLASRPGKLPPGRDLVINPRHSLEERKFGY